MVGQGPCHPDLQRRKAFIFHLIDMGKSDTDDMARDPQTGNEPRDTVAGCSLRPYRTTGCAWERL
jgi:hypothetical protein